jgi:hypothetical protein
LIPSLNEEKTIGRGIQKAKETLEAMGFAYEIIAQKLKKLTPTKAVTIGVILVVIGIIYFTLIIFAWVESDYSRLSLRDENMVALASIALGIDLITNSFILKSMP